jgi:hypothetical protein
VPISLYPDLSTGQHCALGTWSCTIDFPGQDQDRIEIYVPYSSWWPTLLAHEFGVVLGFPDDDPTYAIMVSYLPGRFCSLDRLC